MECRPMTRPKSEEGLFVGRHFDQEVIILWTCFGKVESS
jgi:hypothetical protein